MRKLSMYAVFPVLLLGPTVILVVVSLFAAMAPAAGCGPAVAQVPGELVTTTRDGTAVRLDRTQLEHAATIVEIGAEIDGVGRDGVLVALMAALTESRLLMLANTGAYPESGRFPHDGNGSDHDSLGLFQMRPAAGWGTVADLMDPRYQARAFFGGPDGPNHGSPRGLLDIPGWRDLGKGAAAQAVEVSAFPDRYAAYEPVAEQILDALTQPSSQGPRATAAAAGPSPAAAVATASRLVFPLPDGTWTRTSGFGYRMHPVLRVPLLHAGTDYAAPAGTPVLAVADGVVEQVTVDARGGNVVVLNHHIDGEPVATAYAHLLDRSVLVREGDPVRAGQEIAAVGATGTATGPHLHIEVHGPGGFAAPARDPEPFFAAHDLEQLTSAAPAACTTGGTR